MVPSKFILKSRMYLGFAIYAISIVGIAQQNPLPPTLVSDTPVTQSPEVIIDNSSVESQAQSIVSIEEASTEPGPTEFAIPLKVDRSLDPDLWFRSEDQKKWIWKQTLRSPGAKNINLAFSRFKLPQGAAVWIYGEDTNLIHGPYTASSAASDGRFFSPIVEGELVTIEISYRAKKLDESLFDEITVESVNHGFRSFDSTLDKQGSCNIDVVCPAANPYSDQVRSVARFSINGSGFCTGTLLNNTQEDFKPYFLTANHCGLNSNNASTVVVYWNYESEECGDLNGGSSANNQSGATFISSSAASDFALIELSGVPSTSAGVYYSGWDAGSSIPSGAVAIHHPSADEKAISFEDDPLDIAAYSGSPGSGSTHWRVDDWDIGTTEPGSSGSCLWDPSNKRCVGQLHGGSAACGNDLPDWYGRINVSWEGGGTATTRLSDWLDPNGGTTGMDGADPTGGGDGEVVISMAPANGSTLDSPAQSFSWNSSDPNVDDFWIYAGTTPGSLDLFDSGPLGSATSVTVTGLPDDGSTIYVSVRYRESGVSAYEVAGFTYEAASAPPSGDAFEPDDNFDAASTIAFGQTQARSIHVPADQDYVAFTVDGDGSSNVEISTSGDPTWDTVLTLYNEARQQIGTDDDGGDNLYSLLNVTLDPGTYYVLVTEFDNSGAIPGYTLSLQGANQTTCNGLAITADLSLGQTTTPGDDVVLGTAGADVIIGIDGNDTICGLGGDDVISGGEGNDWIDGGDGKDQIKGGSGDDQISGGNDDDFIRGDRGQDTISGGAGDDLLVGGSEADLINGDDGQDTLIGGYGNDFLQGWSGDDQLSGNDGDDIVSGGEGLDSCFGGEGTDVTNPSCEDAVNF